MIFKNRLCFSVFVIQLDRTRGSEEKVVVDKRHRIDGFQWKLIRVNGLSVNHKNHGSPVDCSFLDKVHHAWAASSIFDHEPYEFSESCLG